MFAFDLPQLLAGNRRQLAKAITLIESKRDDHRVEAQHMLEQLLPHSGKSIRIGITGIPGVGKSTFIEAFGLYLIEQGKKVAVLAVDPSSPITGGSILGDKTRMELLSQKDEAFIRPSPSSGALGGVAQKTRETIIACEAAGYDVVIVETVGVGQSEYEVASMVDFFLVLMLPNAGDELQGIKKGILELADAIVINKADGESKNLAEKSRIHYSNAMHLVSHNSFWKTQVLTCSAREKNNIDKIWQMMLDYQQQAHEKNIFHERRASQNREWMWKLVREMLELKLHSDPETRKTAQTMEAKVIEGSTTPLLAAMQILQHFK